MMGEQNIMLPRLAGTGGTGRSGSSPTSTGKTPVLQQPATASRYAGSGSRRETNSPPVIPSNKCAETKDNGSASSRFHGAPGQVAPAPLGNGLVFCTSRRSLHAPS